MDCQICKNKDICKWTGDMDRLKEILTYTTIDPESPISLEIRCKKYQSEIQGLVRKDTGSNYK